jgi:hypothetical protein
MAADRLAATGPDVLAVDADLPRRIAGSTYTVAVNASGTDSHLTLTSTANDVTVRVDFANRTDVTRRSVSGGRLEIVLTGSGDLEVRPR